MTKPTLHNRQAFIDVLEYYSVSEHGKSILEKINIVLLRAPSGGGRNTIIRELVKTGQYQFIVSDTTRPPRMNDGVMEQDGVEYFFRAEEDMLAELEAGKFLEAELIHDQQVSGISIRELEKAMNNNKISISEVHHEGIGNIVDVKPDAHAIFVTPPSFDEWVKRLKGRGDITEEEFQQRFKGAEHDYAHALDNEYYTFVINDSYLHSAEHIRRIVETNDYPGGVNREAREVAEQIYERILEETKN